MTFQRQDRFELQEHAARRPPAWFGQRAAGRIRSFVVLLLFVAIAGVDGRELEMRIAEAVAIGGRNLVLLKGRLALQAVVDGAFDAHMRSMVGPRAEGPTPHAVNEVGSRDSHELQAHGGIGIGEGGADDAAQRLNIRIAEHG